MEQLRQDRLGADSSDDDMQDVDDDEDDSDEDAIMQW